MSKLKDQFSDMRESTPKNTQWLLMLVAFVLVVILLTLLLSGNTKKKQEDISKTDQAPAELKISLDTVNWADVLVGDKKTQTIKVFATTPVKITSVDYDKSITSLYVSTGCDRMGQINANLPCRIELSYEPTVAAGVMTVPLFIDWHVADETDAMTQTDKIVLILGAQAPKIENKPIVLPKPEPEPEPEPEPINREQEIMQEVEALAPPVTLYESGILEPQPEPKTFDIPDGCSSFTFPAYGHSGQQIGWIKPNAGIYDYHPFSDITCSNPTGVYNPDTGVITDMNGRKIGTDADHIGYSVISSGEMPQLSNAPVFKKVNRAQQLDDVSNITSGSARRYGVEDGGFSNVLIPATEKEVLRGTSGDNVVASQPYDRRFVLRQYKPIPATIVSEVRADASVYETGKPLPVRATVDRNVFSDDGRNIIIPTGTLMLGYVTGDLPGPYKAIGRMQINWYQFIRPDGVEFNFKESAKQPFAGDAQGRVGVPGRGSTDYMEQFIMPMLTAVVPAAVNLIAPVSDAFVNQIDLDNNTVVQSGTVRSSELAKNEIITAWNQVAQKLLVDMMDNTVPPFTIAAGTRITVYSPQDLIVVCPDGGKSCNMEAYYNDSINNQSRFDYTSAAKPKVDRTGDDWIGQARSFNLAKYCDSYENGKLKLTEEEYKEISELGYSYSTVLAYCQSNQYQAINMAKQQVYSASQQEAYQETYGTADYRNDEQTKAYNEQVLGLTYNEDGSIQNPFNAPASAQSDVPATTVLTCEDGVTPPDANGCCPGEIYTDMGEQGFNCCPEAGGDCFPPIL